MTYLKEELTANRFDSYEAPTPVLLPPVGFLLLFLGPLRHAQGSYFLGVNQIFRFSFIGNIDTHLNELMCIEHTEQSAAQDRHPGGSLVSLLRPHSPHVTGVPGSGARAGVDELTEGEQPGGGPPSGHLGCKTPFPRAGLLTAVTMQTGRLEGPFHAHRHSLG